MVALRSRCLLVILLPVAALGLLGCASVPLAPAARDRDAKQFQVPADQALLYVVYQRPRGVTTFPVLLNGQPQGTLTGGTYLLLTLLPGQHLLSSFTGENQATLPVEAQPGQTYFVRIFSRAGLWVARVGLAMLDDAVGRRAVRASTLAQGVGSP